MLNKPKEIVCTTKKKIILIYFTTSKIIYLKSLLYFDETCLINQKIIYNRQRNEINSFSYIKNKI